MQLHPSSDARSQSDSMENSAPSSAASSSISLVSRARTAFHSAAAKAERVITEIKSDRKNDRGENEGQSLRGSRRLSEHDLGGLDSACKPKEEVSEGDSVLKETGASTFNKLTIPQASVLKQLATAFESGKNLNSINDFSTIDEDPSHIKEKAASKFSVVKSIVRREKEDKSIKSISKSGEEEFRSMMCTLFDTEEEHSGRRNRADSGSPSIAYLSKDIRGAPPESFVVRLSEIMGGFKSLQEMALFWGYVVVELRRRWSEEQPVPHMPLDVNPDLNSCLLHQQLQVMNCCIARKHRRAVAAESLDSALKEANLDNKDSVHVRGNLSSSNMHYARINSGDYVLRLGADHPSESLTMLETGEPIYAPITQEGPVLTEELIREHEELVLRTGSVGAGCSQLLSDMQAFKAANPGCVLEDFVRWHSPPDWSDTESDDQTNDSADAEGSSRRGRLSARMQKEGNLWRELWESAKPLPAIKQVPLYDEDLAVDSILTTLEDIQPRELFEQLFISLLCSSFLIAEAAIPVESNLSTLFQECKDYVTATCQFGISSENMGDICKVYETVETIVIHPEEAIMIIDQPEEPVSGKSGSLFKKFNLNFINKDKQPLRRKASKDEKHEVKDEKKADEKHMFSNLFDKKASLFSRKTPKANQAPSSKMDSLDEGDWTIV
ncbi:uncharacterized protein A4U43_C03F11700 [Asparagus officinalis]|uniref:Rab3GAP catalytic subunit conserved domain-containing protein n=1 Tax=Asparagus officinalis TaxID=4686 RepID=A0A5P1FB21_ASPOF|nr:rab3 GTPase-activating protein catalytic subunit [Asparagus officinalis]ONK74943.1 uncharacterized protein A4U43_C03F11700 [Asparagus officinalis]